VCEKQAPYHSAIMTADRTLAGLSLVKQMADGDTPAGRILVFRNFLREALPEYLKETAHPHPDSKPCAICRDDFIWQLLEEPRFPAVCSTQQIATILAQLATELINNSHSMTALQAVTRAFSR